MHYKAILLIVSCIFSSSVLSESWAEFLKKDLSYKYQALNVKVDACSKQRESFVLKPIKSDWFGTLTEQQKKDVILFASDYASKQCYKLEELSFSNALLRYTAETGDKELLDNWLGLNKSNKYTIEGVDSVGAENAIEFINQEFTQPFQPIELIKYLKLY